MGLPPTAPSNPDPAKTPAGLPAPTAVPAAVPSVTVVIPCFNHGRFVAEAVASALRQERAVVRVVVVDDGSNDGSTPGQCDACRELNGAAGRVEVIHQANAGLPAARNRGAREADSDYLIFLDADDWIEPAFTSRLHAELAAAADAANASHAYCQEKLVELAHGVWQVPAWDPLLLMVSNLHPVTALVRTECFGAVGGFDESMREGYEDWDLWLRFASRGWRGVRVREPLFIWRRHSQTTMVMESVKRHEVLYRRLLENHRELYQRHAEELLVIANVLLRRADANWLDENLEAIYIRDLRAWVRDLIQEREDARAALARAEARIAELEGKPALRFSRSVHSFLDRLPGPLAAPARGLLRAAKRAASRHPTRSCPE